ncbi:LysM peptidoglycan-binding domain-containing protein [Gemella sp. GH3]|uniref:LysM peptidoglycan-binding domain-containing protein n=1 Tax=unclassified Gemella TaxID=2624949 RepID=UPI0015CFD35F|nr:MULTISPECIES: LysM peptidoglycan-binding domain-containing protein [unclassified Gemella]MBF0714319.1 LysM peptidoglycan-binding domain-containing protein [Gemella sp. GH3.1]NYS51271.1 LysM peptidoglycan-binding domain-containing protein [Gemella sp. GH3]
MKRKLRNSLIGIVLILITPVLLYLVTFLGQNISKKAETKTNTSQNVAQVPQEEKKEQQIPSATTNSVQEQNTQNNNSSSLQQGQSTSQITVDSNYVVKSGDTLFEISAKAYGDSNAQAGVSAIKQENNLSSDNLTVGQSLKIPKLT